ncbi:MULTISPECIES: hypothetical protein [unclassified Acidovorax]|uniref:hypothetical protein n=1 Tax=unclassified Acidovorax TaxID=2684926 RepID=UPI0028830A3F|nr:MULTISPECIES: hypothetical protein [unclassified Acidovorax]
MILVKTQTGQQAMKDRQGGLTPRQRSAFILFDGKRALEQVLAATAAMGITVADVKAMVDSGLLELLSGSAESTALLDGTAVPAASSDAPAGAARSTMERYQAAYPIATALTAELGLRGFRLNLAVEGVSGYEDLVALAPRIREAVGDAKFARLQKALDA